LPVQALQSVLGSVRKVIVPELNYSGQFAYWLAGNIPNLDIVRLNKCEGIPFAPKEIYDCIAEVANRG
jgi:pyruvate/2-oxoacid:ferredoxin oxidoreductase alpha subunit